MFKMLKRWLNPGPKGNVVYPFRPFLEAMDRKDHALFQEVGPLIPSEAARRWREVYPEDFPGGLLIIKQADKAV